MLWPRMPAGERIADAVPYGILVQSDDQESFLIWTYIRGIETFSRNPGRLAQDGHDLHGSAVVLQIELKSADGIGPGLEERLNQETRIGGRGLNRGER